MNQTWIDTLKSIGNVAGFVVGVFGVVMFFLNKWRFAPKDKADVETQKATTAELFAKAEKAKSDAALGTAQAQKTNVEVAMSIIARLDIEIEDEKEYSKELLAELKEMRKERDLLREENKKLKDNATQ